MTNKLANILKGKIADLNFVGKLAGLTIIGEKAQPTDITGAFIVTKFPISVDSNYEECLNNECFTDLVPNSNEKSVIYFEDISTTPVASKSGVNSYVSNLRLVAWINNRLIQSGNCMSINHILITEIRKRLESNYFNSDEFTRIRVNAYNVMINDPQIFKKYTYPIESVKFLMHPYEAFAIDFKVSYDISQNCYDELILNPEVCES